MLQSEKEGGGKDVKQGGREGCVRKREGDAQPHRQQKEGGGAGGREGGREGGKEGRRGDAPSHAGLEPVLTKHSLEVRLMEGLAALRVRRLFNVGPGGDAGGAEWGGKEGRREGGREGG